MARVLFVCLHKAGRSQMSQAFFARMAQGHHEARSAGTTPAELVLPEVIRVMRGWGSICPRALRRSSRTSWRRGRTWW